MTEVMNLVTVIAVLKGWLLEACDASTAQSGSRFDRLADERAHVDDLYCTGHGEKYEKAMKELSPTRSTSSKSKAPRFCGKNVGPLSTSR